MSTGIRMQEQGGRGGEELCKKSNNPDLAGGSYTLYKF